MPYSTIVYPESQVDTGLRSRLIPVCIPGLPTITVRPSLRSPAVPACDHRPS